MNHFDILTCGSATVDVFAHTDNEIRTLRTHGHNKECMVYPVGEKLLIKSLQEHVGGGGTNTACAFARLGLHTGYIGALGRDSGAQTVHEFLRKHEVSFLGHHVNEHTGYSVVLDSIGHDRTILTYKGANNKFSFTKAHLKGVKAKGLYCSSMVSDSFAQQVKLCTWARKQGMLVAYNPSCYQTDLGLSALMPLLKRVDILIFNKEEAQGLLKTTSVGRPLLKQLTRYVPTVVVTDGSHSICAADHNTFYQVYPKKVKVVETTGAGDAFASALFAGLVDNLDFGTCLQYGLANSQSVIGHIGAKNGLLSRRSMQNYIKRHRLHTCVHKDDDALR